MNLILSTNTLAFGDLFIPHAIGAGGIKIDKVEGDRATPVGVFPFRRVFYRSDRIGKPNSILPVKAIESDDGWCDDPNDSQYNRFVKLPYPASHEKLWLEDHVYNLILVVGHNDNPVVKDAGSCIFVHLARPGFTPTYGCVAMSEENLLKVIEECTEHSKLIVNL